MRIIKQDLFGHKRYSVRMSMLLGLSLIIWLIQFVPYHVSLWASIRSCIIATLHFDEKMLAASFADHREFMATVVWTLTTVLSTFLVMYYDHQGTSHYGVSQRKIISYGIGYGVIPLCIIINIIVVFAMTVRMYLPRNAPFYVHAVSSIFQQMILIIYCIYVTSNKYSLQTIKKLEHEWVALKERQGNVHVVPLILDGNEPLNEKYEALTQILDENIKTIDGKFLIPYLMDNLDVVASKTEQMRFFYGMIQKLFLIDGSINVEGQKCPKRFIVLCSALNSAAGRDDGIWDYLNAFIKNGNQNGKEKAYAMLRTTLAYMILMNGYIQEPVGKDIEDRIKNLFADENGIRDELKKNDVFYKKWIELLFDNEVIDKDDYVDIIYTSAETSPSLDVNGSLRAAQRLSALGGKL